MKNLLLIDDKPELRSSFGRELARHGYRAIPAADGREGLKKLAERNWDCECVVTDLNMPGMDGWELLTRLRRLRNDLPLITISLHRAWQPSVRAEGAWDFWGKLEDPARLVREVEAVIRKARKLKKLRKAPRRHIEGRIIIHKADSTIRGRICNVSRRGLLCEVAVECQLDEEFQAECIFEETRIIINRLHRDWESIDAAGKLVGTRIEKISSEERAILQELLA